MTRLGKGAVYVLAVLLVSLFAPVAAPAFEPINSPWDTYYDLLALQGKVERPYLTIRQLSRNRWDAPGAGVDHPWSGMESLNREIVSGEAGALHGHGVELFGSFNTAYPSGGNDGAMWQGRGVNGNVKAGLTGKYQHDFHSFSVTLFPQAWLAQNKEFELVNPTDVNRGVLYGDDEFGHFSRVIDLPQRHGDDSLINFGIGDSEARYEYKSLSIGVTNQEVWLGPGKQNSLILSNNAGGFPRFEIGMLPFSTGIGAFEFNTWIGRLEVSDYFQDVNYTDRFTYFSGIAAGYAPSFLPGLTLGINRVYLRRWSEIEPTTLFAHLDPEFLDSYYGRDNANQLASLTADWTAQAIGLNLYFEWFREDFSSRWRQVVRAPEHSVAYTLGGRQIVSLMRNDNLFAVISGELTQLMTSRDYEIDYIGGGPSVNYGHGYVLPGYTHLGQLLGGWIGPGADMQYGAFDVYHEYGNTGLFVRRWARNKDILYMRGTTIVDGERRFLGGEKGDIDRLDVEMSVGIRNYLQFDRVGISAELVFAETINRNYIAFNDQWNTYGSVMVAYGY